MREVSELSLREVLQRMMGYNVVCILVLLVTSAAFPGGENCLPCLGDIWAMCWYLVSTPQANARCRLGSEYCTVSNSSSRK